MFKKIGLLLAALLLAIPAMGATVNTQFTTTDPDGKSCPNGGTRQSARYYHDASSGALELWVCNVGDSVYAIQEQAIVLLTLTDCSSTIAEGTACWDSDDDTFCMGDGAACASVGGGSAVGVTTKNIHFSANGLSSINAGDNNAPTFKDTGTNIDIYTKVFDDTTDECAGGVFQVPSDINTAGTATLTAKWYSATATAGNVVWYFNHRGLSEGESWDASATTETADADTTQGSVDQITTSTWAETISNTGWAASDVVEFELCRDPDTDSLVGDAALISFDLKIPRDDSGSGTGTTKEVYYPAQALGSMDAGDSYPAPLKDAGTNIDIYTLGYDDTTDECAGNVFQVPSDVKAGSTITFRAKWYSASATTGNVVWYIQHLPRTEGESWDAAATTETASADTTQGAVDQLTITTWTETLSNTGWAASDIIEFELCRDPDTDTLSGDAALVDLTIEIARAP